MTSTQDQNAAQMGDLAYTEVKTVGNPMNVTRRRQKQDHKMSSSTGRIGSSNAHHTPRRRRRDRVERALAQTDWEHMEQMVGPLPGKKYFKENSWLIDKSLNHRVKVPNEFIISLIRITLTRDTDVKCQDSFLGILKIKLLLSKLATLVKNKIGN